MTWVDMLLGWCGCLAGRRTRSAIQMTSNDDIGEEPSTLPKPPLASFTGEPPGFAVAARLVGTRGEGG